MFLLFGTIIRRQRKVKVSPFYQYRLNYSEKNYFNKKYITTVNLTSLMIFPKFLILH